MDRAYVALGANLGDVSTTLEAACAALATLPATRWVRRSSWYRSRPVEATGPDYLNGVAELDTALSPIDLLVALQSIEARHGRTRAHHHAPRTLDLDLLLQGAHRVDTPQLTLPHPRMFKRAFVLLPLLELLPTLQSPDIPNLPAHAAVLAAEQGIERIEEVA